MPTQKNKVSLKRRFLTTGAILGVIVFILIYRATLAIQTSGAENLHTIQRMYVFGQTTRQIITDLQVIERAVYQQATMPTTESGNGINNTYDRLLDKSIELVSYAFDSNHSEPNQSSHVTNLIMNLYADIVSIKPKIENFLTYSIDVQKRYPGMTILTEQLLPLNKQFIEAADLAIAEAEQKVSRDIKNRKLREIEALFNKARYDWAQQISWVRLFIANRSGVFGDAQTSMKISLENRQLYLEQVSNILNILTEYNNKNELDLQQSLSLEEMTEIIKAYELNFEQAKKIYTSEKWREDLRILQNQLQPNFTSIWKHIQELETLLESNTVAGMNTSQDTSSMLSLYIFLAGIAVFLLLGAGYFLFEYSLHKPITQLAEALDAEARGIKSSVDTLEPVRETAILIDAFKNMQTQVHSRQTRIESILESAAEGIITITDNGVIEVFNRAATELFGYQQNEVIGKNISILIPDNIKNLHQKYLEDFNQYGGQGILDTNREVEARHKDGHIFPMSLKISEMILEGKRHFTAVVENISERKNMIHNLKHLAEHDSLTGLYNRRYFMDELDRTINRFNRGDPNTIALLYIDLDNFKYVNDTMGHLAGDQLLVDAASLLSERTRSGDILARLGGDEFAILLYRPDEFCLETIAEAFCNIISEFVFKFEGKVVDVSASIGAAKMSNDITSREDLLMRADFACHEAKRSGRNRCHMYTENDDLQMSNLTNDIGWARRIKDALDNNRFAITCQPIVEADTNSITYSEVLIRLLDEENEITMPGGFLSSAERFGLMTRIDEWVLQHSLEILSQIHTRDPEFSFSINLSANTVDDPSFISTIKDSVKQKNINPKTLLFEVTESVAMNNLHNTSILLQELQQFGCKTALDDFGIGYSSFAYLKELAVDFVKIDGSIVVDIDKNSLNKAMVRSIIEIVHEIGKKTIAEFVESEVILNILIDLGVDYVQGYHIGKPMLLTPENCEIIISRIA